ARTPARPGAPPPAATESLSSPSSLKSRCGPHFIIPPPHVGGVARGSAQKTPRFPCETARPALLCDNPHIARAAPALDCLPRALSRSTTGGRGRDARTEARTTIPPPHRAI